MILIIVEDWGIVVQKEVFGLVQSELRDACNAEEAVKRLSDSSGNQQLSGKEAEIEKLSGNKQKIKQQLKVVWSLRKTPTIRVNMKR